VRRIPSLLQTFVLALLLLCQAASGKVLENLPYKPADGLTDYEKERCLLDLYIPDGRRNFPTLIWLHGGALTGGWKNDAPVVAVAKRFASAGIAVAVVGYRLSPHVNFPAYIEDTAAAFAWVHSHIAEYGGDPNKVFLGGHSAGGYLSSMVGMDPRYLEKHGLDQHAIAGLIPVSGQMMTHFTVRKEQGIDENTIIADEKAPIYFTRSDTPPMLIIFGDRDWPARLEENQYFAAVQKAAGNNAIELQVFKDRDHGSIADRLADPGDPAARAIVEFIQRVSKQRDAR